MSECLVVISTKNVSIQFLTYAFLAPNYRLRGQSFVVSISRMLATIKNDTFESSFRKRKFAYYDQSRKLDE